jgi:hypothetical protein
MSRGNCGLGAGLGVTYRSSGFRVWTALEMETEEDLLRLTNLSVSQGTSSTLRVWPGRSGHMLVDGCDGS